jgi:phage terminase large subunit-like protein
VPPAGIEGAWSSKDKYDIDRIAGLEGPIETGRLAFADHLRDTEAWLQCARLPHGEHDDAPDAITEADRLTAQTEPTIEDWAAFMRR